MNSNAKVWQIFSALIPIIIGLVTFGVNVTTRQTDFEARLKATEVAVNEIQTEYKSDIKEIKQTLQAILIRMGPEKYQVLKAK